MKITKQKIINLWKNRGCINKIVEIFLNDEIDEASLRVSRRLFARGHSGTCKTHSSIGWNKKPIPWYTYPIIDYLADIDTSSWNVVEFGAGNSTLYWGDRSKNVVAFEEDERWIEILQKKIQQNVVLIKHSEVNISDFITSNTVPDLVAIDGKNRALCATKCLSHYGSSPLYIVDNSDWLPETTKILRSAGLVEIRFKGFGPINAFAWTTSLFIDDKNINKLKKISDTQIVEGGLPPDSYEKIHLLNESICLKNSSITT